MQWHFLSKIKFGLLWWIILLSFFGLFHGVNALNDATNVDADTKNQTGAFFSSWIILCSEKPYKLLSFKFPIRTFGKDSKERSFKPQWYQNYARLHSDVILDKAFCHTCITATKLGKISAAKSKEAFTKTRFQNWKGSLEKILD